MPVEAPDASEVDDGEPTTDQSCDLKHDQTEIKDQNTEIDSENVGTVDTSIVADVANEQVDQVTVPETPRQPPKQDPLNKPV